MNRFHLFEFEDYYWFPNVIRDGGTDFLGFVLKHLKYYQPAVPILEHIVQKTKHHQIVDLCSGNGGPIDLLYQNMNKELGVTYTLTDKFPNITAYKHLKETTNGAIDFLEEPLDILENTSIPEGIRTLFTAIHHFKLKDVEIILKDAILNKQPIAIFDGGDKNIGSIIAILLTHPFLFLIFTPFIKPFKWNRLLFTYILPLIPLYAIWDGVVSILRLHKPEHLLALAKKVDNQKSFCWDAGKVKNSFGFSVAFLSGYPKD